MNEFRALRHPRFHKRPALGMLAAVGLAIAFAPMECLAAEPAAKQFAKLCAACHGPDGKARTPIARKLGVKDLSLSKLSDADIEKQIKEGRKGPDGSLKMPAFEDKLSKAEMDELIDYIKKFR